MYSILESKVSELRGEELPLPVTKDSAGTEVFFTVDGPAAPKERLKLQFFINGSHSLTWRIGVEDKSHDSSPKSGPYYTPLFKGRTEVVWKISQTVYSSEEVVMEALMKFAETIKDLFKDFQIS